MSNFPPNLIFEVDGKCYRTNGWSTKNGKEYTSFREVYKTYEYSAKVRGNITTWRNVVKDDVTPQPFKKLTSEMIRLEEEGKIKYLTMDWVALETPIVKVNHHANPTVQEVLAGAVRS